jgi:serine/threonine protein kinase
MYEFIPERNISDEAKDFVKRLLTLDMTIRMTAKEAIEHPWVRYMLYAYIYIYIHIYIFMYIYIYMYINMFYFIYMFYSITHIYTYTLDMTSRMTAKEAIEHPWVEYFFIYDYQSIFLRRKY